MTDRCIVFLPNVSPSLNIKGIRILPNSKEIFATEEKFKFFIENTMDGRPGLYYFPGQMMRCPSNTLVLFQYDGMVRAVGVLKSAKKETGVNEFGEHYTGYYIFDMKTVHYLAKPIDKDMLHELYPGFHFFCQTKQIIPIEYLDKLYLLLLSLDDYYKQL